MHSHISFRPIQLIKTKFTADLSSRLITAFMIGWQSGKFDFRSTDLVMNNLWPDRRLEFCFFFFIRRFFLSNSKLANQKCFYFRHEALPLRHTSVCVLPYSVYS
jgi:hypothetical protein